MTTLSINYDNTLFYDSGSLVILPRSTFGSFTALSITADGVDDTSISSLPNPTHYTITSEIDDFTNISGDISSGSLTITVDAIGDYTVVLSNDEYVTKTFTITGT